MVDAVSTYECPRCGPVPAAEIMGHEYQGVYDGVLIWRHLVCGAAWPRFQPDPDTGYSKLHDKAVEIIAEWGGACTQ